MLNREQLYKAGKFLAKLAITFAALYLVARQIEINDLKALLVEADISFLILALGLFVVAKLLEARRSNLFFRVLNIQMSEAMNTRLYLLGMFYNLFLPGGIGGDSYRVYWLKKRFQTGLKSLITAFFAQSGKWPGSTAFATAHLLHVCNRAPPLVAIRVYAHCDSTGFVLYRY